MKYNLDNEGKTPDFEYGECNIEIINGVEKVSKKGNPMIEVNIKAIDKRGQSISVRDYLVDHVIWKIKEFCRAFDLDFEEGEVNISAIEGKKGKAEIIQSEYEGKFYPKVKSYTAISEEGIDTNNVTEINPELNDDIPF